MPIRKSIARYGLSSFGGTLIAIALAHHFLELWAHPLFEQIFLAGIPAAAVATLFFLVFDRTWQAVADLRRQARVRLAVISTLAAACVSVLGAGDAALGPMSAVTFAAAWIASFLLLLPTAEALDLMLVHGRTAAWLGGIVSASVFNFFLLTHLGGFYSQAWQMVLIALFADLGILGLFHGMAQAGRTSDSQISRFEGGILLLLLSVSLYLFWLSYSIQDILHPMDPAFVGCLSVLLSLGLGPWLAWLFVLAQDRNLWDTQPGRRIAAFLNRNDRILVMALLFFVAYFSLTNVLNLERYGGDDMFFDSDADTWRTRLSTPAWADPYGRSMHPLALMILRPVVAVMGQLLLGNTTLAVFLLTVLAGTGCVVLTWSIVKEATHNGTYAMFTAAFLGLSTTQLFFGALVETYIFSAFLLLLFVFLLQRGLPFWTLVAAGVLTMGITVSNLVQNLIGFFVFKPNVKAVVRFAALVISTVVLLSIVNNMIYPKASPLFFVPTTVGTEKPNLHGLSPARLQLVVREFFVYSEIAPNPIVLTKLTVYPSFWFFASILNQKKQPIEHLSTYETVYGTVVGYVWVALIAAAVFFFFKTVLRQKSLPRLPTTLALMVAFNFALHLLYGNELFLYTPHFFYAFILFLFLALSELLERRWYLPALALLLVLVTGNNLFFLSSIVEFLKAAILRAGA